MIKFFRNIRQQLLTENKMSKYLLYAIGEIILVVIGILIALQINNWNTEQLERQELQGYFRNISKNVAADLEQLSELMEFRIKSREGSREYMQLVRQDPIPAKEITKYYQEYRTHLAIFDIYFTADQSGFDALKSSGYLGKLQGTDIETELYTYYSIARTIAQEETSINTFIEEMEAEMFKDNIVQQLVPLFQKDLSSAEDLALMQTLLKHPASVGANFRNASLRSLFEEYENLNASGKQLLLLIEEELNL